MISKILNHSVFLRPDYGWAWVFLLLLANDKSRTVTLSGRRVEVKRGQLVWSLSGLQRKLGKGRKWFTAFLELCKDEGMMTVETHAHGAVITILNYEIYNPLPKVPNGQAACQLKLTADQSILRTPRSNPLAL